MKGGRGGNVTQAMLVITLQSVLFTQSNLRLSTGHLIRHTLAMWLQTHVGLPPCSSGSFWNSCVGIELWNSRFPPIRGWPGCFSWSPLCYDYHRALYYQSETSVTYMPLYGAYRTCWWWFSGDRLPSTWLSSQTDLNRWQKQQGILFVFGSDEGYHPDWDADSVGTLSGASEGYLVMWLRLLRLKKDLMTCFVTSWTLMAG